MSENAYRFEIPKNHKSIIKVIGVGGGGSNAVNHMFKQGIVGVDFAICNTDEQAMAFVRRVGCPTQLVVAADGMLAKHPELLSQLPFAVTTLPGGHHLHLNDESGADLVADCFNRFFAIP